MAHWTLFPHAGDYAFDTHSLPLQWARLHSGDAEPCPTDVAVLHAWALFHNGDFEKATATGLSAGGAGITVANKAMAIYANYLEQREKNRQDLFIQVAEQAERQAAAEPGNANAWYWHAYALGRYGQSISVAKALAQGLGSKVKNSLEKAIALAPRHADARIALGAFHAEVIDKVGSLIGGMTYGAKKDTGLRLFEEALAIHPHSIIGRIEYANALVMLEGDDKMDEATELYEKAAASTPADAMERLDVDMARTELEAE
jgi:tetratricopeptide (TPR) repeat protein